MGSFTLNIAVNAPIDTVFDVLTDHRGYVHFLPVSSVTLEQEGVPAPNGVGAIRVFHLLGRTLREQVTVCEAPNHFAYRLLSGAPVRDHVGTVELSQGEGSTRMSYHVETFPKLPRVLHPPVIAAVRPGIARLAGGVAKRAERLAQG